MGRQHGRRAPLERLELVEAVRVQDDRHLELREQPRDYLVRPVAATEAGPESNRAGLGGEFGDRRDRAR